MTTSAAENSLASSSSLILRAFRASFWKSCGISRGSSQATAGAQVLQQKGSEATEAGEMCRVVSIF
jgi:hypothetical protein